MQKKSHMTSFIWTVFLGPFGVFYSSAISAIGIFVLALYLANGLEFILQILSIFGFSGEILQIYMGYEAGKAIVITIYVLSIIIGFISVDIYNSKIDTLERMIKEAVGEGSVAQNEITNETIQENATLDNRSNNIIWVLAIGLVIVIMIVMGYQMNKMSENVKTTTYENVQSSTYEEAIKNDTLK